VRKKLKEGGGQWAQGRALRETAKYQDPFLTTNFGKKKKRTPEKKIECGYDAHKLYSQKERRKKIGEKDEVEKDLGKDGGEEYSAMKVKIVVQSQVR